MNFFCKIKCITPERIFLFSTLFGMNLFFLPAQNRKADSLNALVQTDKADTNKVIHLNLLAWELKNNPDTSLFIGNQALSLAEKLKWKKGIANSYGNLGTYFFLKGDYTKALDYYTKALTLDQELKNKMGIATRLGNIGNVYKDQSDYAKAMDYYLKALKIAEELKDKNGIGRHLGNIGLLYWYEGEYPKALEYYSKALKIAEELKNKKTISVNLDRIGIIYTEQKNYPGAFEYYSKALAIAEEIDDKSHVAILLTNIGGTYALQADSAARSGNISFAVKENYPKAIEYYLKALPIVEALKYGPGIAINLGNIGSAYSHMGKFAEAEKYLKKAVAMHEKLGDRNNLRKFEDLLYKLYDTTGRYTLALIHFKKAADLKDSLFSQENKKELLKKEMNFEFEKKEAIATAEHKKEMESQQLIAGEKNRKQKIILTFVGSGLLLVIIFAGFIFRSLRITRRQKHLIEIQKNEVSMQKHIVEEKQKEILDSIHYAKRIQTALMTSEKYIERKLNGLKNNSR